jgi:hypothetical protein
MLNSPSYHYPDNPGSNLKHFFLTPLILVANIIFEHARVLQMHLRPPLSSDGTFCEPEPHLRPSSFRRPRKALHDGTLRLAIPPYARIPAFGTNLYRGNRCIPYHYCPVKENAYVDLEL